MDNYAFLLLVALVVVLGLAVLMRLLKTPSEDNESGGSPLAGVSFPTGHNPIAEADFHMAYGLYDQATEILRDALASGDESRYVLLKLLEVLFVSGNRDEFLSAAQDYFDRYGRSEDWEKVCVMGQQMWTDEALFRE